jgi:hypothetical protein
MTSFRFPCALALLAAALSTAPALRADDDSRARDAANADFLEGVRAVDRSDYEGALISFGRSYAVWPATHTLLNLASMEARTGHCVDALPHLRKYVSLPDADPRSKTTLVPQLTDSCNKQVGHLRIVAPAGAVVSVDDHRITDPSEIVVVEPGAHRLEAKGPEGTTSRSVSVEAGATADVVLAPAAPGVVSPDLPPESGREPFWSTRRKAGVGFAAAGAVALVLGFVFNELSTSAQSEADGLAGQLGPSGGCFGPAAPPSCSKLASDRSAQKTDATASWVLFGAGGAAFVGGAIAFLLPSGAGSVRASVGPLVTPSGYGLALRGGF